MSFPDEEEVQEVKSDWKYLVLYAVVIIALLALMKYAGAFDTVSTRVL